MSGGSGQSGRGAGLLVRVDGEPMPDAEARAFWQRFSAHMDEHKGDLAGFAAKEGFASVRPGMENGKAVLLVSRTAKQEAYANARETKGTTSRRRD